MNARCFVLPFVALLFVLVGSRASADVIETKAQALTEKMQKSFSATRSGHLLIVETNSRYDARLPDGTPDAARRQALATTVLAELGDHYDFIVVAPDFVVDLGANVNGLHWQVANDVVGIGRPIMDLSAEFGSAGRLKAVIDLHGRLLLPNFSAPAYDQLLDTLMHEVMHQWGVYVPFSVGAGADAVALATAGGHWSSKYHSDASVMFGARWQALPNGRFREAVVHDAYGPLDLYLGGFLDADELPDTHLIVTADLSGDEIPSVGRVVSGSEATVSAAGVLAALGPRAPAYPNTQRSFTAALVLLVAANRPPSDVVIDRVTQLRGHAQTRFAAITRGRGQLVLGTLPDSQAPPRGLPIGVGSTAGLRTTADLALARQFLVAQRNDDLWQDKAATRIVDSVDTVLALETAATAHQSALIAAASRLVATNANNRDELAALLRTDRLGIEARTVAANTLLASQLSDGAFGFDAAHTGAILDTAIALRALAEARATLSSIPNSALQTAQSRLLAWRNATDNCWPLQPGGACDFLATAAAVHALARSSATTHHADALFRWQRISGGFGSDATATAIETATALAAFGAAAMLADTRVISAESHLTATQRVDGSWDGGIAATARAVQYLAIRSLPDLAVQGELGVRPDPSVQGQNIEVRFTAMNRGEQPAPVSRYAIEVRYDAGAWQILDQGDVPLLAAGASSTIIRDLAAPVLVPGSPNIRVRLDADNTINEGIEANNEAARSMTISPAPALPDFAVALGRVELAPNVVTTVPQTLNVSFVAENLGQAAVDDVPIRIYGWRFGELRALATIIRTLPAQGRVAISTSITIDDLDISRINVEIDPDNATVEANEANNRAEATIDRQPTVDLALLTAEVVLPQNPQQGTPTSVTLVVRNLGTRDSPTTRLRVSVRRPDNSVVILGEPQIQVAAGGSTTRNLPLTPTQSGAHRLLAAVDPDNAVVEIREDNNNVDLAFDVAASTLPNLRIDPAGWQSSPSPALQGQPATVRVRVHNNSAHNAVESTLELRSAPIATSDFTVLGRAPVGALAAGASVDVVVAIASIAAAGDQQLLARADVDNAIVEADESDNDGLQTLPVLALPNLQLTAVDTRTHPSAPAPGASVELTSIVRNTGQQPVASASIDLRDAVADVALAPAQTLSNLAAGESRTVTFNFTRPQNSSARIELTVDRANSVPEGREDDNKVVLNLAPVDADFYASEPFFSPNGDGIADATVIVSRLPTPSVQRLRIVASWGEEVASFESGGAVAQFSATWNGRRADNRVALDDRYDVILTDGNHQELKRLQVVLDTNRSPLVLAANSGHARLTPLSCDINAWPGASTYPVGAVTYPGSNVAFVRAANRTGAPASEGIYRIAEDGSPPRLLLARSATDTFDFQGWHLWMDSADALSLTFRAADGLHLRRISSRDGSALDPPLIVPNAVRYLGQLQSGHRIFLGATLIAVSPSGQAQSLPESAGMDSATVPVVGRERVLIRLLGEPLRFKLIGLNGAMDVDTGVTPHPQFGEFKYSRFSRAFYWATEDTPVFRGADPERVLRIDEQSGSLTALFSAEFGQENYSVSVSPSGARMLTTHGKAARARLWDLQSGTHTEVDLSPADPDAEPFNADYPLGLHVENVLWSPDESHVAGTYVAYQDIDRSTAGAIASRGFMILPNGETHAFDDLLPKHWLNGELQLLGRDNGVAVERGLGEWPLRPGIATPATQDPEALAGDGRIAWMRAFGSSPQCDGERVEALSSIANGLAGLRIEYEAALRTLLIRGDANDVNLAGYSVAYQRTGESTWTEIFAGIEPLDDTILGAWSPPAPGRYRVRLRTQDRAGNEAISEREVVWFSIEALGLVRADRQFISPNGDGVQDSVTLTYELRSPAEISIRIVDDAGSLVRTVERTHASAGTYTYTWDGRRASGEVLPDGLYRLLVNDRAVQVTIDNSLPVIQVSESLPGSATCQNADTGPFVRGFAGVLSIHAGDANWGEVRLQERRAGVWNNIYAIGNFGSNGVIEATASLTPAEVRSGEFRVLGTDRGGNLRSQSVALSGLGVQSGRLQAQNWSLPGRGELVVLQRPETTPPRMDLELLTSNPIGWVLERRTGSSAWISTPFQLVAASDVPERETSCFARSEFYARVPLGWLTSAKVQLRFRGPNGQTSNMVEIDPPPGDSTSGGSGGNAPGNQVELCEAVGASSAWVSVPLLQSAISAHWTDPRNGETTALQIIEQRPGRARLNLTGLPTGEFNVDVVTADGQYRSTVGRSEAMPPSPVIDQPLNGDRVCLGDNNAVAGEVRSMFVRSIEVEALIDGGSSRTFTGVERLPRPNGVGRANANPAAFSLGVEPVSGGDDGTAQLSIRSEFCGNLSPAVQRTVIVDSRVSVAQPRIGRSPSAVILPTVMTAGLARSAYLFSPNLQQAAHVVATAFEAMTVTAAVHAVGSRPTLTSVGWIGEWSAQGPALVTLPTRETTGGDVAWAWDGRINGAAAADGEYVFVLNAIDTCGHELRFVVPVGIDTTPPTIAWNAPAAGATIALFENLRATASDVYLRAVEFAVRGQGASTYTEIARIDVREGHEGPFVATHLWHNPLPPGTYRLRAKAVDRVGHESMVEREVIIPQRSPLITQAALTVPLISPNGDGVLDATELNWQQSRTGFTSVLVVDEGGNTLRTVQAQTLLNGTQTRGWDGRNDASTVLPDGRYFVRLRVIDPDQAALVDVADFPVIVDRTAPVIQRLAPAGSISNGRGAFTINLVEANPRLLTASATPPLPGLLTQFDGAGNIDLVNLDDVPEGSYQLNLVAEDAGGNRSTLVAPMIIDRTPPETSLTTPAANAYVTRLRGPIAVVGAASDTRLADWQLTLEGASSSSIATQNNAASGPVTVQWNGVAADGAYRLRLLARDTAGNSGFAETPIVLDNTPPLARIDAPSDNGFVGAIFDVAGAATDANIDSYEIAIAPRPNGSFTTLALGNEDASGVIASVGAPTNDGAYALRLRVADKAGTVSEDFVDVQIDQTPPPPANGLSAERQGQRAARLTIQASAHPDVVAWRVLRNGTAIGETSTTTYLDSDLNDGTYAYRVQALDRAGNASTPSNEARVRIDSTPPEVLITAPGAGERIGGNIAIAGRAYARDDFDRYELSVEVLQPPTAPSSIVQRASAVLGGLLGTWDSSAIATAPVRLHLRALDVSGNAAQVSTEVIIDNEPPAAPTGVAVVEQGGDVRVTWNANTETDLRGYLVYRDARLLQGSPDGDLRQLAIAQTNWLDVGVGDGVFAWRVAAIDTTGNLSAFSDPASLTRSGRPPRVNLIRPLDGTQFDTRVAVRGQSADQDLVEVIFESRSGTGAWAPFAPAFSSPPFDSDFVPAPRAFGPYQLRARSRDSEGLIDAAPPEITVEHRDLTAPPRPSALQVAVDGGDATLTWTAVVAEDLANYRVERAPGGGEFQLLTTVSSSTLSHVDAGLANGPYRYRVLAVDSFDNRSVPSPVVSALIYQPSVSQPFAPTLESSSEVRIGSPVAGNVEIEQTTASGTVSLPPTSIGAGQISPRTLALSDGENLFRFVIRDAQGQRSKATEISVLKSAIPPVPTGLTSTVNGYVATLGWTVANHLYPLGFRVLRGGLPVAPDVTTTPTTVAVQYGQEPPLPAPELNDEDLDSGFGIPAETPLGIDIDLASVAMITEIELLFAAPATMQVELRAGWRAVLVPLTASTQTESHSLRLTLAQPYRSTRLRLDVAAAAADYELREVRVRTRPVQSATELTETLTDGRHRYRVLTINEHAFSSAASEFHDVDVGDATPPAAPVLSGSVNSSTAQLTWTHPGTDLAAFWVFRGSTRIATLTDITRRSYDDPQLLNGAYGYQVYAVDAVGNTAESNLVVLTIDVGSLSPPVGLSATAVAGGGAIDLAWQPGAGLTPAGYRIRRSLAQDGPFTTLTDVATNQHRDTGLTNGTRYYYRVQARDAIGNLSAESNTASAVPFSDNPVISPLFVFPTRYGQSVTVPETQTVVTGRGQPGSTVQVGLARNIASAMVATQMASRNFSLVGDWSPDARHVVVSQALRRATDSAMLAALGPPCGDPQWLNAHDLLVCEVFSDRARIDRIRLPSLHRDTLLEQPQILGFRLSDDGRRLAVIGPTSIEWRLQPNGQWQTIAAASGISWGPRFDPSGRWIVWQSAAGLKRFDVETATTLDLPVELTGNARPSFAKRAPIVLVVGRVGAVTGVYSVHLGTGAATRISVEGASHADFNSDDTLLGVLSASEFRLLRWPDLAAVASLPTQDANDLRQLASDEWRLTFSEQTRIVQAPGTFRIDSQPLQFGENILAAIATLPGQPDSPPALPITVTVPSDGLPDLALRASDITLQPATGTPGSSVRIFTRVRNIGSAGSQATTLQLQLATPSGVSLAPIVVAVAPLASGAERVVAADTPVLQDSGAYSLTARVNPGASMPESSLANNAATRSLIVNADGLPELTLTLDRPVVVPGETLLGNAIVSAGGAAFNGQLRISVFDAQQVLVTQLLQQSINLTTPGASVDRGLQWSPGNVVAGRYLVRATLYSTSGQIVRERELPVDVSALRLLTLTLTPSQQAIAIGTSIDVSAALSYVVGNAVVDGAELRTQLLNASGVTVATRTQALATMTPGFSGSVPIAFISANLAPGAYQIRSEIWAGGQLAEGGAAVTLLASTAPPALSGRWVLPGAPLSAGQGASIGFEVRNTGGVALTDVPVRATVRRQLLDTPLATTDVSLSLQPGALQSGNVALPASAMTPGALLLILEVQSGPLRGVLDVRTVLVVDSEPPLVSIVAPQPGAIVRRQFDALVRAVDQQSFVSRTELSVASGAFQAMSLSGGSGGEYRGFVSVANDGPLALSARARDAYDNVGSTPAWSVIVDGTPPVIVISGVSEGQIYANPVTPVVQATDLHLASTTTLLNGQPFTSGTTISDDGDYTLVVIALDRAGNRSQETRSFVVDRTAPTVAFTFPAANAVINAASTDVRVQTEALAQVQLQRGSTQWQATAGANGSALFSAVPLNEGANLFRATAVDRAGNASPTPAELTVTRLTATVGLLTGSISAPTSMEPGSDLSGTAVLTSSAASPLENVAARLSLLSTATGQSIAQRQWTQTYIPNVAQPFAFSFATATLPLGGYALLLEAELRDSNGQLVWATLAQQALTLADLTPPNAMLVTPATNQLLPASFVAAATVDDALSPIDRVELVIDAQAPRPMSPSGGSAYSTSMSGLSDGDHTAQLRALDGAGNQRTEPPQARTFRIDGTPPTIDISGVLDGQLSASPLTPVIVVSDANPGSQSVTLNGQLFVSGTTINAEREHLLRVEATDAVGNSNQRELRFTIDLTPPPLAITSPVDGSATPQTVITLIASTEPNTDVVLLDTNPPYLVRSNAQGIATFPGIWLVPGENTLRLQSRDRAGNLSSIRQVRVLRLGDNTAPITAALTLPESLPHGQELIGNLRVTSTQNAGPQADELRLDVNRADGSNVVSLQWSRMLVLGEAVDLPFSLPSATWPAGTLQVNVHWRRAIAPTTPFTLIATRALGVLDEQAPTLTVTEPAVGAIVANPVVVSATAQDALSGVATVAVRVGDGDWQPLVKTGPPDHWRGTLSLPAPGPYVLMVRATDGAGNRRDVGPIPICRDEVWTGFADGFEARSGATGFEKSTCTEMPAVLKNWIESWGKRSQTSRASDAQGTSRAESADDKADDKSERGATRSSSSVFESGRFPWIGHAPAEADHAR